MNNVYFPAIKRFDGELSVNFEMLVNPRLEDGIARRVDLSDFLTFVEDNITVIPDITVDGVTITGTGTPLDPLVSVGSNGNIYTINGTLTSNRILNGDGLYSLNLDNLVTATIHSSIDNGITQAYLLLYPNTAILSIEDVVNHFIEINPTEITLSATSGLLIISPLSSTISNSTNLKIKTPNVNLGTSTVNQVLTLSNVDGSVEFTTISNTDTNIYNSNGTLTANRTVTLTNFDLTFTGASGSDIIFQSNDQTIFKPTNLFLVGDAGSLVDIRLISSTGSIDLTTSLGDVYISAGSSVDIISGIVNITTSSSGKFNLKTPSVSGTTAINGQILNLVNFVTGESEFVSIGNVTGFTEAAQDAVGTMVNSTLTYVDGTPSLGINLNNANTWTANQSVPDEAYGISWNGSLQVPTKNALYDKIELLQPLDATLTALAGITTVADKMIQITGIDTFTTRDFKIVNETTYTGTIIWTGTTPPSGTTNHSYRWTRVGNMVTLNVFLVYSVAGTSVSAVTFDIPIDCPVPDEPTGLTAALANSFPATGMLATTATASPATTSAFIKRNAADTAWELIVRGASGNYMVAYITVTYFTA